LKRDQKFFDMYSLVLGVLAIFALGIFVLAMKMSDLTQSVFTTEADEYQAEIRERMQPFGEVYMPGDDLAAASEQAAQAAAPEPAATTLSGPQVYNEACIACHGTGIGGAPAITSAEAWAPRIEKGVETLQQHAIEGFTGSAGYMPPKGGRLDLSDQEIRDAVDYMVSQAGGE
jgi:cytochrome c5